MKLSHNILATLAVLTIIMDNTANATDTASTSNAVKVLNTLRENKTLTLASGPKFIVKDPRRDPSTVQPGWIPFAGIDIHAPHMIREFGFQARLTYPDQSACKMDIASRTNGAVVIVKAADGQPYALLANTLLVMCDPENPGGLAYFENGSTLWGFYQMPGDSTGGMDFRMNFVPTNVLSAAFLDVDNILRNMLVKTTNATTKISFNADTQTVRIETENSTSMVVLAANNVADPFGIQRISLQRHVGTGLEFSSFTTGRTPLEGLFQLTKQDVEKLGLPMRGLTEADFITLEFIPSETAMSPSRKRVSDKLRELIDRLTKNDRSTSENAPPSAGKEVPNP